MLLIYKYNATPQTNEQQQKMNYNRASNQVIQGLSLMIPRVFPQWVNEETLIDIFKRHKLGIVYKVSIIYMKSESRRCGHPMYKAIVYFSVWYDNIIAYNFQQRIFANGNTRVVYDDPWFWVAVENKRQRLTNNDKRIIRVAYQNYVSEQNIIRLTNNISAIKTQLEEVNRQLSINRKVLGDDKDGLSDTAIECAMSVLYDE
jgi:hypothetical protein